MLPIIYLEEENSRKSWPQYCYCVYLSLSSSPFLREPYLLVEIHKLYRDRIMRINWAALEHEKAFSKMAFMMKVLTMKIWEEEQSHRLSLFLWREGCVNVGKIFPLNWRITRIRITRQNHQSNHVKMKNRLESSIWYKHTWSWIRHHSSVVKKEKVPTFDLNYKRS